VQRRDHWSRKPTQPPANAEINPQRECALSPLAEGEGYWMQKADGEKPRRGAEGKFGAAFFS